MRSSKILHELDAECGFECLSWQHAKKQSQDLISLHHLTCWLLSPKLHVANKTKAISFVHRQCAWNGTETNIFMQHGDVLSFNCFLMHKWKKKTVYVHKSAIFRISNDDAAPAKKKFCFLQIVNDKKLAIIVARLKLPITSFFRDLKGGEKRRGSLKVVNP